MKLPLSSAAAVCFLPSLDNQCTVSGTLGAKLHFIFLSAFVPNMFSFELCVLDGCCLLKETNSKFASDDIDADEGLTFDTPDPHLPTLAAL